MAEYEIPFTDATNKGTITVPDGSPNVSDTSLALIGDQQERYGVNLNTNFLHLLENFADVNPPANPVEGQLWYDTTSGVDQLKIYDGTNWVAAGGLKKGTTEPETTNSVAGDLWVDTTNNQLYLYSGSAWLLVGPSYSDGIKTGAIPETIIDTNNVSRLVVINYANNVPVSIASAASFVPKSIISGFSSISAGITLSTNISGNKAILNGEAKYAERLTANPTDTTPIAGTILASAFMRNDQTSLTSFPIQIRNNGGLEVGSTRTVSILAEGTTGVIDHSQTGSSLDLRVNNSGTSQVAIRVKSDTNVGINNLNPVESLDVTGNVKASGNLDLGGGLDVNQNTNIAGNLVVGGTGIYTNTLQTRTILPESDNDYSIGSNPSSGGKAYSNVWAYNVRLASGGFLHGNVTGNVSGSAGTAAKLTSPTTFSMSGDVSATNFVFDGQTGGSTKTFTTTIDPAFVSGKPSITTASPATVQTTDELLINRGGVLYRATQDQVIDSIPTTPIGTVVMFAGQVIPNGWLLCDGSEQPLSTYEDTLAAALGYDATDNSTWYFGTPSDPSSVFVIPDYRGRFPLGVGLPGGATRVTDSGAGSMGGLGGAEEQTITVDNLPEHQHDLQSSAGDQFYATATASYTGTGVSTGNGDTAGTGSTLQYSGTILGGTANDPLTTTPPFAAINFIIYTGVIL
jgi:microcystin-dependent protein